MRLFQGGLSNYADECYDNNHVLNDRSRYFQLERIM